MADRVIKLEGRGLRGESFADVARRVRTIAGLPVTPGATDAEVLDLLQSGLAEIVAAAGYTVIYPARAATIANITLSGEQTIDGVAAVAGDRVLVKNQTAGAANGIYAVAAGAWSRVSDFDSSGEVVTGSYVPVEEGSQAGAWVLVTTGTITVGTTAQVWRVFSYRSAAKVRVSATQSLAQWIASLLSATGALLVGWKQAGTAAVLRTLYARLLDLPISVKDFGALGNATNDDTSAVQAAIDYMLAANGGILEFPRGTYMVSSLTIDITTYRTLQIRGEGKKGSAIGKVDDSTTPLLTWNGGDVLDVYGSISDMGFLGVAKNHHAIALNGVSRFRADSVLVQDCDTAIDAFNSLNMEINDPSWLSNNSGLVTTHDEGPYANNIRITGGEARGNTKWAFDISGGIGVSITGVNVEYNGTEDDDETGTAIFRSSASAEIGYAIFNYDQNWGEAGLGAGVVVEAGNTIFNASGNLFVNSDNGANFDIGAIYSSNLNGNLVATGTISTAASVSIIKGGFIHTVNCTSPNRDHFVITSSGFLDERVSP